MATVLGLAELGASEKESSLSATYLASDTIGGSGVYSRGSAERRLRNGQVKPDRARSRMMHRNVLRTTGVLTALLFVGAGFVLGPGVSFAATPGADCGGGGHGGS